MSSSRVSFLRKRVMQHNPMCYWCGGYVDDEESSMDHLMPKSRGGTDHAGNLVLAHKSCNNVRGNTLLEEMEIKNVNAIKAAIGRLRSRGEQLTPDNIQWESQSEAMIGIGYIVEYLRRFGPSSSGCGKPAKHGSPIPASWLYVNPKNMALIRRRAMRWCRANGIPIQHLDKWIAEETL